MSSGLIEIIKRSAIEAIESRKPCDLRYGTVISTSPLKVRVTPQFVIPQAMLIVPQQLTDYEIEVTIKPAYDWKTKNIGEGIGSDGVPSHDHKIDFTKKKIQIHGALKVGEKVVMVRQAGGQNFLILDRLVGD
jgi:hypothetical protein